MSSGLETVRPPNHQPKVSVLIITYNQELFIAQAIESALIQETNFDFEIIVGDDCSTDRTREIVVAYSERYPERMRILLHPHRLGPHKVGLEGRNNLVTTYKHCRGKYVAFLEGDDYWIDPNKLQKQVEFLDSHPDCTICCHPASVVYSDERSRFWPSVIGSSPKQICTIEDILRLEGKPEIPTPSMMIRRDALTDFPHWFSKVFNTDYALHLLLAHRGKIGFLKECMAAHRKHGQGASRMYEIDPDYCHEMLLKLHLYIDGHFEYKYHPVIRKYIEQELQELLDNLRSYYRTGDYGKGIPALLAFAHYYLSDLKSSAVRSMKAVFRRDTMS